MLNFLPQKNKQQVIFEYLLRVTAFFLFFTFLASLILSSLFLPSFFFAKFKNDKINEQLVLTKQKNTTRGEDPILFIKNVNRLVIALSNKNSSVSNSEIINKIISLKNKGIKILSVSISEESGKNTKKILIYGLTNTRDNLDLFEKEVRIDGFFSSVSFPPDYYYRNSSEFSATLILQI